MTGAGPGPAGAPPGGDAPDPTGPGPTERLTPDELRTLFLFAELDDDQLVWLAERGRVVEYPAGAVVHTEGEPASCFYVLLDGTIAMSRRVQGGGGELELFRSDYRGAYTGSFNAWLVDIGEPQIYMSTTRAVTDVRFLELPATDIGWAVKNWFPMAAHLMVGAATQGRQASATIERHERLVALGTVTAGLTHELNNPATAVVRATASLRERLYGWYAELGALAESGIDSRQLGAVAKVVRDAVTKRSSAPQLSPLDTSDREDELAGWLDGHGVADGWDVAPTLVAAGLRVDDLATLVDLLGPKAFPAAVGSLVYALEADALVHEVTEAAGRITGLLASAKQYTQMDRAPLQEVDVHDGIDATLTMLGHKLGDVRVVRDYDRSLPALTAYPAELNQVWTNLVDNALDAMDGEGTLTIRTAPAAEGDHCVLVEV
ncbi:MAG TPA: cyclic nucleotide-binding domain-containing protein, partial [Acidimicrobiales bacterium]